MNTILEQQASPELVASAGAESQAALSELSMADLSMVGGGLAVLFY